MPRRRKADMTYAQRVTEQNDTFRAELLTQELEAQAEAPKPGRDDGSFKAQAYKQALKEAKEAR